MVDAFRASGKLIQFLSVRPQFNAHRVITADDGTVTSVEDMSVSDVRINGGFFVVPPRAARLDRAGRRARRGDLRATDPARRGGRVPVRGLLRSDGHDQGPPAARRRSTSRAARRGGRSACTRNTSRGPPDARRSRCSAARRRSAACSRSAATPTTSRSAAAGRSSRSTRGRPDVEVTWVVLGAEGDREAEARASAEEFLARRRPRRGRRPRVPGRATCRTTASR